MLRYLRLLFDNFTLVLLAVVAAASLLPAHGQGAEVFNRLTAVAIALLFLCTVPSSRARPLWPAPLTGDCICWCLAAPLCCFR
ncbi:hypothetical protein MBH78_16265 [Oceanimonas sp. NS1]|nr:hypothetical protein [Oceanimonas sp. NS1]